MSKPKKPTYGELTAQLDRLSAESHRYFLAFQDTMNREFNHCSRWVSENDRTDGAKYKFYLIRATSPGGAFVLQRFSKPGNGRDYTTIHDFDRFFSVGWVGRYDNAAAIREELVKLWEKYNELNRPTLAQPAPSLAESFEKV